MSRGDFVHGMPRSHTFVTNWHKLEGKGRSPAEHKAEAISLSFSGNNENGALNLCVILDGKKMEIYFSTEDTASVREWLNRCHQPDCSICGRRKAMPDSKVCETCMSS
jgi:hypothetical protein